MAYYRFGSGAHEKYAADEARAAVGRATFMPESCGEALEILEDAITRRMHALLQSHGLYGLGSRNDDEPDELTRLAQDFDAGRTLLAELYDYENALLTVRAFMADWECKDYWLTPYFISHFEEDGSIEKHRRSTTVLRRILQRRKDLHLPEQSGQLALYKQRLPSKIAK